MPPPLAAKARDEQSSAFKASLPPPNIRLFGAAPPRTSVCRLQHVLELRVPNRCIAGEHLISCRRALDVGRTPGNQTQNYRSHIAMSRQLSFAWKASLTRTPPPICTSALGSHTALVRRALSVANELQIHHARFQAIRDSTPLRDSSLVLQRCNCGTPHQVFESAHRILQPELP